jgi:hypothetical protein
MYDHYMYGELYGSKFFFIWFGRPIPVIWKEYIYIFFK